MGRPRKDSEGVLCPRCGAVLETRPTYVVGQHRVMLESSCILCGHLEYPEHRARKIVMIDLTDHPNIFRVLSAGSSNPGVNHKKIRKNTNTLIFLLTISI